MTHLKLNRKSIYFDGVNIQLSYDVTYLRVGTYNEKK